MESFGSTVRPSFVMRQASLYWKLGDARQSWRLGFGDSGFGIRKVQTEYTYTRSRALCVAAFIESRPFQDFMQRDERQ
jgi:hypothetical protein